MSQRYSPYDNQGYQAAAQQAAQPHQGGQQQWSHYSQQLQQGTDPYSKYHNYGHYAQGYGYSNQQGMSQHQVDASQRQLSAGHTYPAYQADTSQRHQAAGHTYPAQAQGANHHQGRIPEAPAQQTMQDHRTAQPAANSAQSAGNLLNPAGLKQEQGTTYSLGPLGATVRLGALPADFKPDMFCLDTNVQPIGQGQRVVMKRDVHPSDWATKLGIAGIPLHQVPVANLMARGLSDLGLRRLSHGHETSAVLCFNTGEGVFVQKLLTAIRRADVHLDSAASLYWANNNKTAPPSKFDKGSPLLDPLIAAIVKLLNTGSPAPSTGTPSDAQGSAIDVGPTLPVASQDSRVQKLEAQVLALTEKAGIKMSPLKAPPEQDHDDPQATAAFRPYTKEAGKSVLDNCELSSHTPTAVKKWISLLATTKTNPKIQLEDFVQQVETAFGKMKTGHQPSPKELAIRWGLPMRLASSMAEKTALKVAAAAAWLAA